MKNESNQHWDLVGDIHGELKALTLLLAKLGYREEDEGIVHPEGRKLIFVGDLIDRGLDSRGVLHFVRRLMDSGQALVVMGNHEYNFIAYHTRDAEGKRLRLNTPGHRAQIAATMKSFEGHEEEIADWSEWMKGLPFFLDFGDLRVVHASWVPGDIAYLADKSLRDRDFLIESARRGSRAWEAIGRVLKGVEIEMPDGIRLADSNGILRKSMRVRWWGELAGLSWSEIAFPPGAQLPEGAADLHGLDALLAYGPEEAPVFFGHYKLKRHPVGPQAPNVATLDYGLGHGGGATAYRWNGERVIERENFVEMPALSAQEDPSIPLRGSA
ncbi:MAG: diadenosine tetraphosphatase [Verrucomicrobiaceae bacterium]|nr:diadenosine tetraphosphatase [Verrucomicrobiaceae bacterium]